MNKLSCIKYNIQFTSILCIYNYPHYIGYLFTIQIYIYMYIGKQLYVN